MMALRSLLLVAVLCLQSAFADITACPANATTINYDDGTVWEICPHAYFNGTISQNAAGTLSPWDCLQQCTVAPSCQHANYRASDNTCQFISSVTRWVNDSAWSSVRFDHQTSTNTPQNTALGVWTSVLVMPIIPVAVYIVPQYPVASRAMMFSSWSPVDFKKGADGHQTQFVDYNYTSGASVTKTVVNTNHDMFCPGISSLEDGRLLVSGGSSANLTSIYDPNSNTFTSGPNMQIARGYHTSAITSRGQVFTIGGSYSGGTGGKNGELYDPASNTWSLLPGALVDPILTNPGDQDVRRDNHPWLYGWKNGSVFHAGPSPTQHWFNTTAGGSYTSGGTRDSNTAMCAIHVMYDAVAGKIFSAGGSNYYTILHIANDALTKTFVTTIGDPYVNSTVVPTAKMLYKRGFGNGVALPDGTVLITGGMNVSIIFSDAGAVLTPELWDPASPNKTTPLAAMAIPRTYHSFSLLLSDGRVMVGGGGLCDTPIGQSDDTIACNRTHDHPDIEIFSPPYLFNADSSAATRPVIKSVSSNADSTGKFVHPGGTLTVRMDTADISTFSMLRMGSVTHSTNSDQRRVPIANTSQNQAVWTLRLPADPGILLPGFYFLFAINSHGTPSIAMTVRVAL